MLDDSQLVTRGQQIEFTIRPVYDDALARSRMTRPMFYEIGGEMRPPLASRALAMKTKRGRGDEDGDDDDKARDLSG